MKRYKYLHGLSCIYCVASKICPLFAMLLGEITQTFLWPVDVITFQSLTLSGIHLNAQPNRGHQCPVLNVSGEVPAGQSGCSHWIERLHSWTNHFCVCLCVPVGAYVCVYVDGVGNAYYLGLCGFVYMCVRMEVRRQPLSPVFEKAHACQGLLVHERVGQQGTGVNMG